MISRTMFLVVCVLSLCRWCDDAHAQQPRPGRVDPRVQHVTYVKENVTRIYGQFGIHTLIVFSPRERIRTVAVGFSPAWEVIPLGDKMTVKLKRADGATNMTVVTDIEDGERLYHFDLLPHPGKGVIGPYQVTFNYPTEKVAAAAAVDVKDLLKQGTGRRNVRYSVDGAGELRPRAVWDNGVHTFFLFWAQTDLPAIYVEDDAGQEALLNTSTKGDVIAVHKVGKKFVLRRGWDVACVFNDGPPERTESIGTGTVSPAVRRVVK